MKTSFSLDRIIQLMYCDLFVHKKKLLLFSSATLVLSTLVNLYLASRSSLFNGYIITGREAIFMMLIATSFSFFEMDFADKQLFSLNTPASNLEKYISRLMITLVGYFLIIIFAKYFSYFIIKLIMGNYLYGIRCISLGDDISSVKEYLLGYSIYFFGAVFFRKNEFIKTASILGVILIIGLILSDPDIQWKIANFIFGLKVSHSEFKSIIVVRQNPDLLAFCNVFIDVTYPIFRYFSIPFLLVLGYFRLKEEEVKDGIQ